MLQRDELQILRWRTSFVGCVIAAAFLVLLAGFWSHQIVRFDYYDQRAEDNRVREIPLTAPRGRIYDRYNRVLADNRPSYNVVLIREDSPRTVQETAKLLSPGIGIPESEILDRINRKLRQPKFRPIVLKEDVSVADMAFVKSHQLEFPEITVEFHPRRRYLGDFAAHALGYVGEISDRELAMPDFESFKSGDLVGKSGLEREYNGLLSGQDGYRRVVVNKVGREMGKLDEVEPIPGNDLYTTIDLDLQKAAEDAIGEQTAAAVAIDPQTGEVLAMVSKPAFDPNLFATRISSDDWTSLTTDPRRPLQNRVIQNHYQPGSVFKIFMAAAGIEADVLDPLERVFCPGHGTFFGHTFGCHKPSGHGSTSLHDAIVNSCNVFFYTVGRDLGIDKIYHYTTMMGLGRKSGIDLPNEVAGLIPSPQWKQRVQKAAWYPGETISVSIGQGAVTVTPMQAAWAMGGLASGGRLMQPHLVSRDTLKKLGFPAKELKNEEYPISNATVDVISKAMWGVVNEPGTGTRARIDGFDVAGKTGTAQVVGKQFYSKRNYEDHAWFVGYAPYRNPEIVVAVFVENGGHGGVTAAPVAHAVMETYYKKKTGRFDNQLIAAMKIYD